MCGIAGWLGMVDRAEEVEEAMLSRLTHRGPDGSAARRWPGATLLHTRLKILDLSPTGDQPLGNEDGAVWVVCNGEIYNHRQLRTWLEARGHVFRGRCDTEVIPHLYEEEGAECVSRLRGMFALAIWDPGRSTMLLARDRCGVKPLFYAQTPGCLAFASELRALRCVPGFDARPDPQAVSDFAALCYVPAPLTWFRGAAALEPGQLLEARLADGAVRVSLRSYHRWVVAPRLSLSESEAVATAGGLVDRAVGSQLESDVPLGALLSGGIDSSLVVESAARALGGRLKTFNVRFRDPLYDETWAALEVARHVGSEHASLALPTDGGEWEQVIGLLRHCGQPFADTSLFAVSAVCGAMRRQVTVALSGDGGDEGFGGYSSFLRLPWVARWLRTPAGAARAAAVALRLGAAAGLVGRRAVLRVGELKAGDDVGAVETMHRWVREEEHRLLVASSEVAAVRRWFEPRWELELPRGVSPLERLSALTTEVSARLVLPSDYLFKVDIASMRSSLEVRVPFLDEDLFGFGLTLPHRLKVSATRAKRVLRDLAQRCLPVAVAAKKKAGFGVPFDTWVSDTFRSRLKECLLGRSSALRDVFRAEVFAPWVEAFCARKAVEGISREGLYQRVVMLLAAQLALSEV